MCGRKREEGRTEKAKRFTLKGRAEKTKGGEEEEREVVEIN